MIVKKNIASILGFCVLLFSEGLFASTLELPSDLATEILSEVAPSANPLEGISVTDYEIDWQGEAPPGAKAELETDSLQWVRIIDLLVLPRARMRLTFSSPLTARVIHGGFSTGGTKLTSIDFPVALLSNPKNEIKLRYEHDGSQKESALRLRMKPRQVNPTQRIHLDSSCSKFAVNAQWKLPTHETQSWIYIACRFVSTNGDQYRKSSMEMYVIWDETETTPHRMVDGIQAEPTLPSLWALRLGAKPGRVTLRSPKQEEFEISYSLSERHYKGFLGLGIGPYMSEFNGVGEYDEGWSPLLTLYGSVYVNETLRVVGFDATSISNRLWTDLGIYLSTENAKMFDQRLTMNLLFGGHIIGFRTDGKTHAVPSFPQGFEFIYADAFARGYSGSLGGFIYPEINGRSYYNLWIRWGGRVFWEINYLAAKESFDNNSVSSKSLGLTVGFPMARFW
jgi:hypothetical protein